MPDLETSIVVEMQKEGFACLLACFASKVAAAAARLCARGGAATVSKGRR